MMGQHSGNQDRLFYSFNLDEPLTDLAARWTAAPGGPAFYDYSTNYLIDVHAGVIVDVEAKFRPAKCLPQSRRSLRRSREFVAKADSIREHDYK